MRKHIIGRARKPRFLRFVRVNPDRGYGDGMFTVVAEHGSGRGLTYEFDTGDRIFAAHCYEDSSTRRATSERKRGIAESIGRK
jgi:hypothetical protein